MCWLGFVSLSACTVTSSQSLDPRCAEREDSAASRSGSWQPGVRAGPSGLVPSDPASSSAQPSRPRSLACLGGPIRMHPPLRYRSLGGALRRTVLLARSCQLVTTRHCRTRNDDPSHVFSATAPAHLQSGRLALSAVLESDRPSPHAAACIRLILDRVCLRSDDSTAVQKVRSSSPRLSRSPVRMTVACARPVLSRGEEPVLRLDRLLLSPHPPRRCPDSRRRCGQLLRPRPGGCSRSCPPLWCAPPSH